MKNKGFTLIELMIVVAIIAIIAAIAIPNLLRSRLQSNESTAIGNLRTVVGAQSTFASAHQGYASTWAELRDDPIEDGSPAYLDIDLANNPTSGYIYDIGEEGGDANPDGTFTNFEATAVPSDIGRTGERGFFVDASGVIRWTDDGSEPDTTAPPLGDAQAG